MMRGSFEKSELYYRIVLQSNLHKRATFLEAKTVQYTQVVVLSRVSQSEDLSCRRSAFCQIQNKTPV